MTMIGIDPHKATHTAVAVDDNEVVLDEFRVRASTVQAQRLIFPRFPGWFWCVDHATAAGRLWLVS